MRLVTLSQRSNFIKCPIVRTYHSYFFQGISGRNGKWSPIDCFGIDSLSPNLQNPYIQYNNFGLSEFTTPGKWPVVSERLSEFLGKLPLVRCLPVAIHKVFSCEWTTYEPITIEPGDMGELELFSRFESLDPSNEPQRFEFQTVRKSSIADQYSADQSLEMDFGTDPGHKRITFLYSKQMLLDAPVIWESGTLIFRDDVWKIIEDAIDPNFFNVREYFVC